jgi:RNA polymerase sigma factor (sigma-70 family)
MIRIDHPQRRTSVLGDAELARAAQNGDAARLGILLERYRASFYALALRFLGHGPEAQDAVQGTFLIALNNIDRLREAEVVAGWLRGILCNVCLRRLRERRGEILFEERPSRVEERSFESSAEQAIDRLALREWVWAALYELSEVLRVTAMLRYFDSYPSYEEISATLGVLMGTVRSRLNQVKIKLAEALLRTAGLEHDEARKITASQTRYFRAVFDEFNRGEAYYAPPGHVFEALENCQTIEFSPKEPFEQLLEVVGKNLEAMGES